MRTLSAVLRRGVRVWVQDDQLQFAPEQALSQSELQQIRHYELDVIHVLRQRSHSKPPLQPRQPGASVPLSAAQESMWLIEQIDRLGTTYSVCAKFMLLGELNRPALERS